MSAEISEEEALSKDVEGVFKVINEVWNDPLVELVGKSAEQVA